MLNISLTTSPRKTNRLIKQAGFCLIFLLFGFKASAQMEDLQLAMQFSRSGELQKANDIYLKLYKQSNEGYFQFYFKSLIGLKKFDEAESVVKKMIRKHPEQYQYTVALGTVYHEKGAQDKADNVYNDIIKNMPAEQTAVNEIAMSFYQAEAIDFAIKAFIQGRKILHNDDLYSNELTSLYRYKHDKVSLVNEYINMLQHHPEYASPAKNMLAAMFEGNDDYNMLKGALLKAIQQYPQQTVFADLLTWQYLQQKQFDQALIQAIALSRRLNDGGSSLIELGQTLVNNQAYDEAIRAYDYIISKGKEGEYYFRAKMDLLNAKNLKVTTGKYTQADILGLETGYQELLVELGRNATTAFAMQKLARLQAFKLHKLNDAQKLLEEAISFPNIRQRLLDDCKLDLGDIYLLNNKPWDATLMYSQVEKSSPGTPIAQEAQYRNAKLAYYIGDFNWAKGQLDVLKAATSQLIANDALNLSLMISDHTAFDSTGNALKMYARADLLIFKEDPDKAVITLDSIDKAFPGNNLSNDILMAKARILIQKNDYAKAIINLKTIADNKADLWADDAVYMLGDIYENQLADKVKAQAYYQQIITDYPGSPWLTEARKRFRSLRGDVVPGS
jgi:tetratricopeptide (TPR) repeat protein